MPTHRDTVMLRIGSRAARNWIVGKTSLWVILSAAEEPALSEVEGISEQEPALYGAATWIHPASSNVAPGWFGFAHHEFLATLAQVRRLWERSRSIPRQALALLESSALQGQATPILPQRSFDSLRMTRVVVSIIQFRAP